MKSLSVPTKLYLAAIYLLGLGVLVWNVLRLPAVNVVMVFVLGLVASFFMVYKVEGATNRSHYTFSFLVYGFAFAFLSPGETLIVILISNLVEWIWNRPPWFIQIFNTACYISVMAAAYLVFTWINPSGSLSMPLGVLAIAASLGIFTLLNHLIVGFVVWLARGENFKVSGILEPFPLIMDLSFLTIGALLTMVWNSSPYALILFLFPLYLIYSTLKIPALERKTELDQKTGLFNHEYFMQHLEKELERSKRFDRPLSIIMLDLDLLRNINNTYGHLAGDEVLNEVAAILKRSVREYDVVARFGGEEFIIMLPETVLQQSLDRAEMIRREIESAGFSISTSVTSIKVTISIGIAERESFVQTGEEIIHNADTALYHSKLSGRNKSFAFSRNAYLDAHGTKNKGGSADIQPLNSELHEKLELQAAAPIPAETIRTIASESVPDGASIGTKKGSKSISRESTSHFNAVHLYIACLATLAALLFYGLYRTAPELYLFNPHQTWPGLLVSIVFVLITEYYSIDLFIRKTSLSTSAVPILAGTLLFGPIAAVILSATYAIIVGIKYRSKFNKYVFNFSNQLIAALLYTSVIHYLGKPFSDFPIGLQGVLAVLAALMVYLVNTALISIGMGIDLSQPPSKIWKEQYAWLFTIYVGIGLIATGYIFGYQEEGIFGTLFMMAPLVLLRISQKQYVDRTRAAVTALREKNVTLEKNAEEINRLNDSLLDTLAEIIDLRDPYVSGHSKRVTTHAVLIAEILGLNPQQVKLIHKASLLHDIGKLGISNDLLNKPGKLTREEYETIKKHAGIGSNLVKTSSSLLPLVPIIRHHHEYYNGEGYPDRLAGSQIPIEARIVSVADAIEAMTTDRPYRKKLGLKDVIKELMRCSGSQFDPLVVDAAVQLLEKRVEAEEQETARQIENIQVVQTST
jgi:diguanylate cyclase (GGDEF)-like protein/putative nucleotidyltransferase with HDIG domain